MADEETEYELTPRDLAILDIVNDGWDEYMFFEQFLWLYSNVIRRGLEIEKGLRCPEPCSEVRWKHY